MEKFKRYKNSNYSYSYYGKTTERVVWALKQAILGKNIVFVSNTRSHLRHAVRMAHDIISSLKIPAHGTYWIQFPSGSSIRFVTADEFKSKTTFQIRGIGNIEETEDLD